MLHVTLSLLSVGRAKMLHVTSWDLAGVRTGVTCYIKISFCWQSKDVTCYVMGFGWSEDRCYMLH